MVSGLRTLDERVVPRLARGLRRVGGAGGRPPRRGHRSVAVAAPASRGRALTALAVLAVAAVVGTAVLSTDRAPVDETVGDVVRVGPVGGDLVPAYVTAARAELAGLPPGTQTYALVQLTGYTAPAGLEPYASGVRLVRAYARVPVPRSQTEIVALPVASPARDLPGAMRGTAARKEREAEDLARTAAGLSGGDARERGLQAFYRQSAELSRTEAAAYRRACACVYALVVIGAPGRLRELARLPGVRAVDPAPEVERLDRTVFLPLLPEQRTVVAPPPDAALPGVPPTSAAPVAPVSSR